MEKESSTASSLLSTLSGWLNSSGLLRIGSATLIAAMALALGWAWYHRGAVQMRPFEGTEGPVVSLRLSRALEDVALGATSDLDVDPAQFQVGESSPPPIVIPGTGLSFNTIVSFVQVGNLAPTDVHGTFAKQSDGTRFFLQVIGPAGVKAIVTEPKQTLDDAVSEAAVGLYGALRPAALAAYLYRRDTERSLDLVRETLSDPNGTAKDRAAAYRVWGLILRDRLDFDGARAKFNESMQASDWWDRASSRGQALTLVDIGHTYQWEQRWRAAATYYQKASDRQPKWAAPLNYLGDAWQRAGDTEAAIAFYKRAIDADSLYVEPWNGLGDAYASQRRYNDAIEAYSEARNRHLKRDGTAATTYYGLGDALLQAGCADAAAAQYELAVDLDLASGAARLERVKLPTCRDSLPSIGYPWRLGAIAEALEKPCALAASTEPVRAPASVGLTQGVP